MRVLGIDYGEHRIGLAISDPTQLIAQNLETIQYENSWNKPCNIIATLVKLHNISEIVIGLPKNMNGSIGPSGEKTLAFTKFIKNTLDNSDIKIINWDERLSTVSAIKTISDTKVKKAKRRNLVDQVAASYILQSYLDYKRQ